MNKYTYYLSSVYQLLTGIKNWPLVVRIFLKIAPPGPYPIDLRQSGLRLKARGVMDVWSIKETFLDRFYERFGVRVEDGWTVVDIGGGIGDYTLFAARATPHGKVYAFEPFPGSFSLLQENLAANQKTIGANGGDIQAFPEAIWSQEGALLIDSSQGEPGQFISRSAETRVEQSTEVPSISLAQAFDRQGITRCDLMKIDCEGAEYPILFTAPDAVLAKVQRIVMEYHDSVVTNHASGAPYTHRDMQAFLESKGYRVRVVQNFVHADLGYLYAWREQGQEKNEH